MSELQIGLLGIGIAVLLALYGHSWWQQRQYRRKIGVSFKSDREDALYRFGSKKMDIGQSPEESSGEKPLTDQAASGVSDLNTLATDVGIGDTPGTYVAHALCDQLDNATDYIAVISPKIPSTADVLERLWQQRFDFGKNVHVCGQDTANDLWKKVVAESRAPYTKFKLALQLVDRSGAVSRTRLSDFSELVRTIADHMQAELVVPSVTQAAARALELDKFCASVDQMIGLNIFPDSGHMLSGNDLVQVADKYGLSLQADGLFHFIDAAGHTLFSLGSQDGAPLQHHTIDKMWLNGLTLLLDVPSVEHPALRFDHMVDLARQIATDLHSVMADDHHVALSDAGILLIRDQIAAIEGRMLAGHVIPGSVQARRLFS